MGASTVLISEVGPRDGLQSVARSMATADKFAWIGSYAAYLTPEVCDQQFPDLARSKPKLLWLGVGKSDFLYQPAQTFEGYLKSKEIPHQSLFTEGGHTWMNARHYLAETLQLFFK